MDAVIAQYFTSGTYFPDQSTDWTGTDWNLASFQTVYEWGTKITSFYNAVKGFYRLLAKAYFASQGDDAITDVYDFSKLEVHRGTDHYQSVVFNFIGVIQYYNSVVDKTYTLVFYDGGWYSTLSETVYNALPENITTYLTAQTPDSDRFNLSAAKYYTDSIV